jgi:CRISPR-associated endoribonuclease Cas6
MPASYVARCQVLEDYLGDDSFGRMVHAWLFTELSRRNSDVAKRIHDSGDVKPFTVSAVHGPFTPVRGRGMALASGSSCWFRWTALDPEVEELSDILSNEAPGQQITLGTLRLAIQTVSSDASQDAWAGKQSYDEIWNKNVSREEPVVQLHFETPTTFRSQGRNRPLPSPELVYRTLLEKWQKWGPVDLTGLVTVVEREVDLSRFRIESRRMVGDRFPEVGFVGTVTYSLRRVSPIVRGAMHALAAYSFYAGVGAKTSMGFGQVRPVVSQGADGAWDP